MTNIVIVDDHALFRSGIRGLLEDMPDVHVIGEASNGAEAVEVVQKTQPDVILLDVNMPVVNGVEAVRTIKEISKAHIIMLTVSKSDQDLINAIAAGADGYILKNATPQELYKAIQQVQQGLAVLSPEVTRQVMVAVVSDNIAPTNVGLSSREKEVLSFMARGLSTAQISHELFISENTVKTHIRHILEKLEVKNRNEAAQRGRELGLIK
ncbi:MAG: response regulator [Anaerolineales bacterium]